MTDRSAQFDLSGRVALVTGASSGLGAQFAMALAAAGAKVVAGARRLDRLQALAERIRAAGGEVEPVELDVEDEASIQTAYDTAERVFGTVDTVIANAGVNAQGASVDLPAEELGQLLRVNIQGVYLTAREGARRLIASPAPDRGRIILLGSVGSFRPLAGLTAYQCVLAAGIGRARWGINVNTICPGWIATELNEDWLASEAGQKLVKGFPRRRTMSPKDLDSLILFLSSDASASLSGGVFAADEAQSQA